MPNSITPEEKSRSVVLSGMMAFVQTVIQRFRSEVIDPLIPSQASAQNQLADKAFVNSSIATATATYRGNFNLVSDLELTIAATEAQIAAALATAIQTADNNDYCYVQVPTADGKPTEIARIDRYKNNGTAWALEYTLNNSGFTAAEWTAINSGITSGLVAKLTALPTMAELTTQLGNKVDKTTTVNGHALSGNVSVSKSDVGLGSVVNTGDSATPVSGGTTKFTTGGAYTELAKKADKNATVSDVTFDSTTGKLKKTINGTATNVCDVVTSGFHISYNTTTGLKTVAAIGAATVAHNTSTGITEYVF